MIQGNNVKAVVDILDCTNEAKLPIPVGTRGVVVETPIPFLGFVLVNFKVYDIAAFASYCRLTGETRVAQNVLANQVELMDWSITGNEK
jgi:hypothetical protein